MKLKKHDKSAIVTSELPHYYEVSVVGHPNGVKKMCIGSWRDVEPVLQRYPDSTVNKVFPPAPPQTVDVPHFRVKDQELPMQQILPQSELEEIKL